MLVAADFLAGLAEFFLDEFVVDLVFVGDEGAGPVADVEAGVVDVGAVDGEHEQRAVALGDGGLDFGAGGADGVDGAHVFLGLLADAVALHHADLLVDETVGHLDNAGFAADVGLDAAGEAEGGVGAVEVGAVDRDVGGDAGADGEEEEGDPPAAGDDFEIAADVDGDVDAIDQGGALAGGWEVQGGGGGGHGLRS